MGLFSKRDPSERRPDCKACQGTGKQYEKVTYYIKNRKTGERERMRPTIEKYKCPKCRGRGYR